MSVDIDAIKARYTAATEGPWLAPDTGFDIITPPDEPGHSRVIVCGYIDDSEWREFWDTNGGYTISTPEDREFIAAARTDVPDLVAEVERLRNSLRAAEAVVDAADAVCKLCRPGSWPVLKASIDHYNDHCRETTNAKD